MSRGSKESHGLQVFPFLAVLICTMGSLIFLLLVTTRQARERAINLAKFQRAQQRQAKQEAAAAAIASPLPTISIPGPIVAPAVEPEPEPEPEESEVDPNDERKAEYERELAEREREIEELKQKWDQKNRQLVKVRDRERAELLQRRAAMRETSEQSDSLKSDLDSLETQIGKLSQQAAAALLKAADDAEQKSIERQVAEMKRRLRAAQMKEAGDNSKFQVVPFDPQTGTTRRPILIECTGQGIRIQPEGITITPADFDGFTSKANPLAAATGAIINYWNAKNTEKKNSRAEPEPYVLLLVRPDGIFGYYVAMKMLEPIRTAHGYELLEDQTVLQLPEVDPEARAAGINAIERLMAERDEINRSPRGRTSGGAGGSDGGGNGRPQRKGSGGRGSSGVVHAAGDGAPGGQPGGGGNTFSMDDLTGRERSVGDRSWERIENFEGQPRGRRSGAGGPVEGNVADTGQVVGDASSGSESGRTGRASGQAGNNANGKGGSTSGGNENGGAGTSVAGGFASNAGGRSVGGSRGSSSVGGTGPAGTASLGVGGGQPGGDTAGRPGSALDNPESVLNADPDRILPPGVESNGRRSDGTPGFGTATLDGNQMNSGGLGSSGVVGGQVDGNGGETGSRQASAFGSGSGGSEGGGGEQSGRALDNPDAVLNADNNPENSQPRRGASSKRKSVFGMTKMPGEEAAADGADSGDAEGSDAENSGSGGRSGQGGFRAANAGPGGSPRGGSTSNGASGGWQPQGGQSSSGSFDDYGPSEPGMPIGQRPKRKKKSQQYNGSSSDDQSSGSEGDPSGQAVSQRQAENEALLATRGPAPSTDQVTPMHRGRRPKKSNDEPKALEPEMIAGRRWGISEPGASIGFEREVRVDVYPDRFVIAERFDVSNGEGESKQEVYEDFIKVLERHSREWGRPPTGFFWTPRVKFVVKPDANLQYEQINTLMNRSGLSTAREFTKSAEKQYGREANWTKPGSAKKESVTPVGAKP